MEDVERLVLVRIGTTIVGRAFHIRIRTLSTQLRLIFLATQIVKRVFDLSGILQVSIYFWVHYEEFGKYFYKHMDVARDLVYDKVDVFLKSPNNF